MSVLKTISLVVAGALFALAGALFALPEIGRASCRERV